MVMQLAAISLAAASFSPLYVQAQDQTTSEIDTSVPVNPKCLVLNEWLAGEQEGDYVSDLEVLKENLHTDSRINGFQICSTEPKGKGTLTAFRLITSKDFGESLEY